jgi:hypothetical protein
MSLFDRMGRRAELCGAMMSHLGIDPVLASRMTLGTMMQGIARTCMLCRHSDECAAWLESAPEESADYRKFCPNAEKFDGTRR